MPKFSVVYYKIGQGDAEIGSFHLKRSDLEKAVIQACIYRDRKEFHDWWVDF
jgi:hypothetical protein